MKLHIALLSGFLSCAGAPCDAQMPPFRSLHPGILAVDVARNRLIATNIFPSDTSVEIFDVATNAHRTVPLPGPTGGDVDALTGRLYIPSHAGAVKLVEIDPGTATIVSAVPLHAEPATLAIVDAEQRRVFVLQQSRVAIVDVDSHAVDYAPLSLDVNAYEAVVNPLDHRLYATATDMRALVAVDPVTLATTTISISSTPSPIGITALTLNKATNQVLMLTDGGKTLAIVDVPTYRVTTIPLPGVANRAMAVDGTTGKVYIPNPPSNALTIVDTGTRTITSVAVPAQPNRIAVNEATGKVYMGLLFPSGVLIMDRESLAQLTILPPDTPFGLVLDRVRDVAYFAGYGSVLVVDGKVATAASAMSHGVAVEFHRPELDHYVVTADTLEMSKLDHSLSWVRTGATFGTFRSFEGTTSMCRFYLPPGQGDSHLMMASQAECAATAAKYPGFVYESPEVFRVALPDAVTGVCPSGLLPAYRTWNQRKDSNHRYVVDTVTRDAMAASGSTVEGFGPDAVGICVPPAATYTLP